MRAGIGLTQQGGVARVTLHHPARFNAMTRQMWRDLRRVFVDLAYQDDLRCVLVSGEGAHFCAGGDISEYPDFRFEVASLRQFHEGEVWPALQAMLDCDVPVVAQIAGNCMGAGLEIASCCDVRLAAANAAGLFFLAARSSNSSGSECGSGGCSGHADCHRRAWGRCWRAMSAPRPCAKCCWRLRCWARHNC